jgi:hypothetical protein
MFFVMLQIVVMLSVVIQNVMKRLIISIGEVINESLVFTRAYFLLKQATFMRRPNVLSIPFQFAFPCECNVFAILQNVMLSVIL